MLTNHKICLTFLLVCCVAGDLTANEDEIQAVQILQKYCSDCHQHDSEGGIDYIEDLRMLRSRKKIFPGNPDRSRIWIRINDKLDPMPPEGMDGPTAEEKAVIKNLILSFKPGDPKQTTAPKKDKPAALLPVPTRAVVESVHQYLSRLADEDRAFKRFFVMSHLHNAEASEADGADRELLRVVRAATAKTLNSLTWAPELVLPKPIDPQHTVLAFDLRDVQWDRRPSSGRPELWNILSESYPYALDLSDQDDVGDSFQRIKEWTRTEIPWIRADWFIANATQPQYYHAMLYDSVFPELRARAAVQGTFADNKQRLEQPMSQDDLFHWVRVDLAGNLLRSRAKRAAFTRSGVSSQPRMIERHAAAYGYLWNSYDFKKGSQFMNLNARPLGPRSVFSEERFGDEMFDHDGGEMIFGLPNGLHGFLLVDAKGNRISFGPTDVVEDRAKTLGNGMIVNGLSCIACHKNGLIEDFSDEVRSGVDGLRRDAKRVARKLFVDRADLDPFIQRDQVRYRRAAIEVLEPYLDREAIEDMKDGGQLLEPVGPVAKRFLVNTLDLNQIAFELGVSPERLSAAIQADPKLKRLGLIAITQGGKLSRELWESGAGTSMFQKVSRALDVGTPAAVMAENWRGR